MKKKVVLTLTGTILAVVALALSLSACAQPAPTSTPAPVSKIAPEARLTKVSLYYSQEPITKKNVVTADIVFANASSSPQRYLLSLDFPDGRSWGGFVPVAETAKLDAGKEATSTYHLVGSEEVKFPDSFSVSISVSK